MTPSPSGSIFGTALETIVIALFLLACAMSVGVMVRWIATGRPLKGRDAVLSGALWVVFLVAIVLSREIG
jgi:hypothetical protein